jgi:hypothetical protein
MTRKGDRRNVVFSLLWVDIADRGAEQPAQHTRMKQVGPVR